MFGQATIPDLRIALDQTPAAPNPLQQQRLAEALYYARKHYRECDTGFPATFDQLWSGHSARYYGLGDYLVARRSRAEHEGRMVEYRTLAEWLAEPEEGEYVEAAGHACCMNPTCS